MPLLKRLFWVYFLLLIFEGALRKWVVPQLAAPLLLVRDPISLLIIWEAYRTSKWPKQWTTATGLLTLFLFTLCLVQTVIGNNPWFIALYGLRSYLLPFPVAFIMGENLDADDLRKFGNSILWLILPLTALEVAQYLAPATSFLNTGAGAGAGQIGSAAGHVRASATFSYVTGTICFAPLAAAFILYGLVNDKFAKKWLLLAATSCLILSIPISGSRSVVFELLAVLALVAIAALFGVSQFAGTLKILLPLLAVSFLVSLLPVFSDATTTLMQRFAAVSSARGDDNEGQSAWLRVADPIIHAAEDSLSTDTWTGTGMGYGSIFASTVLTGSQEFLSGEGEVDRVTSEFGPIFGFAFLLFRWLIELTLIAKALAKVRDNQPLAWLLIPLTLSTLSLGILEQPTEQGFMVIGVAFSLAALKLHHSPTELPQIPNHRARVSRIHAPV